MLNRNNGCFQYITILLITMIMSTQLIRFQDFACPLDFEGRASPLGIEAHASELLVLSLSYVNFTDRTVCITAGAIIPLVRTATPEMHATLISTVRLSWEPVGVGHCRYSITVCIGRRHSPDECGRTTWVNTLSSRPEVHSVASTECCL